MANRVHSRITCEVVKVATSSWYLSCASLTNQSRSTPHFASYESNTTQFHKFDIGIIRYMNYYECCNENDTACMRPNMKNHVDDQPINFTFSNYFYTGCSLRDLPYLKFGYNQERLTSFFSYMAYLSNWLRYGLLKFQNMRISANSLKQNYFYKYRTKLRVLYTTQCSAMIQWVCSQSFKSIRYNIILLDGYRTNYTRNSSGSDEKLITLA